MKHYYAAVRRELKTLRGKEVVTTGDGLLATFDAAVSGVRCATAIREAVRTLGLEIRVVAARRRIQSEWGWTWLVSRFTSARASAAKARAGEVLVSSAVGNLDVSSLVSGFKDRGVHRPQRRAGAVAPVPGRTLKGVAYTASVMSVCGTKADIGDRA